MTIPVLIATILRAEGETGVQTHVQALARWLQRSGSSARIVTPFDAPKALVYPLFGLRRAIHPLSTALSVWWYRHWHKVMLQRALADRLQGWHPCVVYAQCPLAAEAALKARLNPSQQVVMVVHFNISQADEWAGKGFISNSGRLYRDIARFEGRVLPALDGLVFVSDFMRREVVRRVPAILSVPFRIIPNFLADPGAPQMEGREQRRHLINIGTLEPRKNQAYALHVIAATKTLGTPLNLTLVGDGPDRARLRALAEELRIEDQVEFAGYVPQAAALMQEHQAVLHVAQIENCPYVVIESMSRGLPVFAPATGGVPETFDDGVQGRFIPLDNPTAAARALIEWMTAPERLAAAAVAARARFLEVYVEHKSADRLAAFLVERPAVAQTQAGSGVLADGGPQA